jgi:hypothetical protein
MVLAMLYVAHYMSYCTCSWESFQNQGNPFGAHLASRGVLLEPVCHFRESCRNPVSVVGCPLGTLGVLSEPT